jgi:hypothetical protein
MTGDEYQPRSPYLVGPPIQTVDGFYGRRMQIDSFFENLNRPQLCSQRILGARRSGKTSFLRHVSNPKIHTGRIRTPGLPVIFAYVDLQGIATEPTALPHARALHDHRRSGPDRTGPMLFFREVASAIAVAAPSGKKIRVPKTFRDSASFDTWLGGIGRRFRLVVLLDEFETLVRSDGFGLDFFRKMRALTSGKTQLAWATASYRDVVTLSRPPGAKDLASPLYNVFHPDPIYMGPLEDSEAEALVANPAARHGIELSGDEVRHIREIAGNMPFFLQAAAEKWLIERVRRREQEECSELVIAHLMAPGNLVREQLEQFWASLFMKERQPLKLLTEGKGCPENPQNHDILAALENYGFLGRQHGALRLQGRLLQHWIRNLSSTAHGIPRVFIGHGRSPLWLKVKEVADKDLGLIPICYESKPRTGQSIVPILQEMLDQADFAILVMTGEDLTGKGDRRPRQNVVHEAGLFQGRLGFERTVLLVEKGVEFLSNLHGMQVIGFKGDDIEGTFWNLSRVLRRV